MYLIDKVLIINIFLIFRYPGPSCKAVIGPAKLCSIIAPNFRERKAITPNRSNTQAEIASNKLKEGPWLGIVVFA